MNGLLVLGRIAFVAIFVFSGVTKLLDIQSTANFIATKVTMPHLVAGLIPAQFNDYLAQIEGASGMSVPQWLATIAGLVEVGAGLMIAANIGMRLATFALIVFTALATFYFHDFWNLAGDARTEQLVHALKNLSIVGALLILFALGRQHAALAASALKEPERF
jgi:uncharacterized membrane protein YphA (DoxX/SURF4 family)